MSHHLTVSLAPVADGRATVDYRQPVAVLLRRINARIMHDTDTPEGPRQVGSPEDLADKTMIVEAMAWTPELFCADALGDDGHNHPPATPDPVELPPYRHGQGTLL
jgi:hypothetical protein